MRLEHGLLIMARAALAALAVCGAPGAAAQTAVNGAASTNKVAEDDKIASVIVTARRRSEESQSVPVSMTAVTGEQLERRGVESINELARFTPNLVFDRGARSTGGGLSSSIFIRGVGQNDFNSSTDPGVGIYVDGVYFGRSLGSVMDALDLERVEVLRGPQGTLFGKNTIGGAMSLVSRMPSEDFRGQVQVGAGQFGERRLKASVDVPMGEAFAAKLSASYRRRDGYTKNPLSGVDFDDVGSLAGRMVMRWEATTSFSATTIMDGSRRRENGSAFHLMAVNPTAPLLAVFNSVVSPTLPSGPLDGRWITRDQDITYSDSDPVYFTSGMQRDSVNDLDGFGISQTFDWDIASDLRLTSISAYRSLDTDTGLDTDGSPLPFTAVFYGVDQHQMSQELRLNGRTFNARLDWVTGVYFFNEVIHELYQPRLLPDAYLLTGNPGLDITPNQRDRLENTTRAVYVDGTFHVTDALSLSAGIRCNRDEKEFVGESLTQFTGRAFLAAGSRLNPSWSSWTPKGSIEYQLNDEMLLYASAAKGFKSGGVNPSITKQSDFKVFDPEELTAYEIGFKSDWFQDRLRVNVAGFTSEYSGMQFRANLAPGQFTCPIGGALGCQTIINAAAADVWGVELEVTAKPVEALDVFATAGYLHNEFKKIDPILVAQRVVDFSRKLPRAPEWSISAGAEYAWDLRDAGRVSLRGDYSYRSETFQDIDNSAVVKQPAYGLVNARVAFTTRTENMEFALMGFNLSDERYLANGIDLLAGAGVALGAYSPPRTWTASFEYRFGDFD